MLKNNQKIIGKQHDNKAGRNANESMFLGTERELRKHKNYIVPEYSGKGYLELEQGWNFNAGKDDMLRVRFVDKERSIKTKYFIFKRKDFEQGLFLFAEGDESLKYAPSII